MHNVFTVAEVAAMLRATPAAVRQRLRNGTLGGFRIGTDWRIPKADLDAFIEQNRNGYRPPIPPQDDDADLIAEAEAEAALDRIERGEEKVWTFDEWKRRGDALDR